MIKSRLEIFLALLVRRRGARFVEELVHETERRRVPPAAEERQIKNWVERLDA